MWIRSQDRKKLKEIHDVDIYHDTQIWGGCSFLGQYSNVEKALKDNGLYEAYDDMVLIKQALIERDRKIYGLQQHNRNLEDKLGRIGGYHYGNPKQ